jgi:xanthine dehydrogenase YagS FAD-binding subunit
MASIGGNLLQRTRCGYFRDTAFPCNKRQPGSGCPAQDGENRGLAILGGSKACIATFPGDLAVALVALDAVLLLENAKGKQRRVPLVDFHLLPGNTPQRETVLEPGELIVSVTIPAAAHTRKSMYLKVRELPSGPPLPPLCAKPNPANTTASRLNSLKTHWSAPSRN